MDNAYFIGIDIGTQGTKTVLCDKNGTIIADSFEASELICPDCFTVYEDAEKVFGSVIRTIKEVVTSANINSAAVRSIGMDSQMASIIGVDRDFNAVTPLDSWLDARCSAYTEQIKKTAEDLTIGSSGGQVVNAHSSKILWWKHEQPEVYERIEKFVMPNGYVAGKLCGLNSDQAFMDYTFLHFNSFSDNKNLCFNKELLKLFSVEEEKLPTIVKPTDIVGTLTAEMAQLCGLTPGTAVIAGCGDTAASSLGAGVSKKGLAYDVAGTASVFACATDRFAPDTKSKTILFARSVFEDLYIPLAYISGGGLCLKWFSDLSKLSLKELDEQAASYPAGSDGITFIPHFSGRTCPLDNHVSGAFLGLCTKSCAGNMYRSILESIAFEYKSYYDILKNAGSLSNVHTVYGVGGGAKSKIFSQIKADALSLSYQQISCSDSAPVAVALLGAFATGFIDGDMKEFFFALPEKGAVLNPNQSVYKAYEAFSSEYLSLLNKYSSFIKE